MKKKIVILAFSILIVITLILGVVISINSYLYELENFESDKLVGLGAFISACFFGFVLLYEIDLFYTVYYFVLKPKTVFKTIFNILSNLSLVFCFFLMYFEDLIINVKLFEYPFLILFVGYIVLRTVYFCVATWNSGYED